MQNVQSMKKCYIKKTFRVCVLYRVSRKVGYVTVLMPLG